MLFLIAGYFACKENWLCDMKMESANQFNWNFNDLIRYIHLNMYKVVIITLKIKARALGWEVQ